ncbi:MAG TPA: MFS transporter [Sphingobacteriaceae bacterium]|nr:MFS transporter [Sphingobacteriaceae bacterium]
MIIQNKQRLSISLFFFISGICFATWTSRIPTIKIMFALNEAELGTLLLALPIGSLIGLPISGWLVSRYDSRVPLGIAFFISCVCLAFIGFSQSVLAVAVALCLFAFTMKIFSVSVNTQAIALQKQYDKKILGVMHGLWSGGGIIGILISTLMVYLNISYRFHLLSVAVITALITLLLYNHLLRNDRSPSGNKLILGRPDPYIFYLGVLVFLAAVCEGGMFDWSGIYFQEVLKIKVFTYGFLIFMICMTMARFMSDYVIKRIGMSATYIISALCIITGIGLTVFFPIAWIAMAGFSLVGIGTAAIVPISYSLAGFSNKYSPGMAISIIATYAITGMLVGPPMIGYLAHTFNLQISFILFAICGVMIIPVSQLLLKHQRSLAAAEEEHA